MWRVILLTALLAGCMTAEERAHQLAAQDDGKCRSYGAQPGSVAYVQCRAQLDAAQTQATAAVAAAEASVPMPPSMAIPRPTPSPTYSRAP